jgi:uncharacterized cupredoxin-like copper-binding protein
MRLHRLSLLGAVVVVVGLSGCGGGSGAGSSQSEASSTTTSSAASQPSLKTVTISEKEFSLTPGSVSLSKPGTYTFKAVNKGTITHSLEIEGNGVEQKASEIGPGSSTTITVDLKNGSYEMYCPVDGHKNEGMKGTITVGSSSAGGIGTTTQTDTTPTTTSRYGY